MAAIVSLFALGLATYVGIFAMKLLDQRTHDRHRKTYRLHFPSDLDADRVSAWVRSISGTLRRSPGIVTGAPTIAFELWASERGITHRLKVPWQHADYVISQLRSLVPGIRVTPEDEWPHERWTRAIEAGLSNSARTLRIASSADMSASLLASVQALAPGEQILLQWVVTPAIPKSPPTFPESSSLEIGFKGFINGATATRDEIEDRRKKLAEPNVLAVLRVAAVASTEDRADHLIYRVKSSLASARGPSTRFVKRVVTTKTLQGRLDRAAGVVNFPMQLSTPELAALIAWPIGNPFVSGLPPAMSRHLPATELVPRDGRVLGRSNFPGNERPIAMTYEDARKHVHVTGPTGVGKTVLLANMLRQDIERGYGVILLENKGDLYHLALNYVPPERMGDVVIIDVNDTKWPVGFNMLNQGDPRVVIDEISALFDHLYKDARGVWTREVLYHGLRTLTSDPRLSFIDLAPLLNPMTEDEIRWRDGLIRNLRDAELRSFWQRLESQPRAAQDRITQPVMDRIWQLNARPEIRNIIGQSDSAFQMNDIIANNTILLVNLAGLPRDSASLTGTLLMNSLWHAVKTTRSDRPSFLYLDEFQDFMDLPVDPEDMLAKARSFGLGMVLAHQHLGQLPTEMRQAVMANARTKVVFQSSSDDARAMTREFGSSVEEDDFQNLGRFEAIARVATGDGVSHPLSLSTNEPARSYGRAEQIKDMSRSSYSKPAQIVESEINARRVAPDPQQRRRPTIGGSSLG